MGLHLVSLYTWLRQFLAAVFAECSQQATVTEVLLLGARPPQVDIPVTTNAPIAGKMLARTGQVLELERAAISPSPEERRAFVIALRKLKVVLLQVHESNIL
jgi:hypothetical protein